MRQAVCTRALQGRSDPKGLDDLPPVVIARDAGMLPFRAAIAAFPTAAHFERMRAVAVTFGE